MPGGEGRSGHRVIAACPDITGTPANGHWFWSAFNGLRDVYIQVAIAVLAPNVLELAASIFTMVVYDRILPNTLGPRFYVVGN